MKATAIRIDELPFCEPAVLEDHSAVEEGHDGEAAAKNERTGVGAKKAAICRRSPASAAGPADLRSQAAGLARARSAEPSQQDETDQLPAGCNRATATSRKMHQSNRASRPMVFRVRSRALRLIRPITAGSHIRRSIGLHPAQALIPGCMPIPAPEP